MNGGAENLITGVTENPLSSIQGLPKSRSSPRGSHCFTCANDAVKTMAQESMIRYLETGDGYEAFRQGLAKNFAEENLIFWRKVEDLHSIINQAEVAPAAEEIYKTHLARRCPAPITVRYEQVYHFVPLTRS